MLRLKEQVFGEVGYTTDMKLSVGELAIFRELVNEHWLSVISNSQPALINEAEKLGIENYHQLADQLDHVKLWPKSNRVLPPHSVQKIKDLPFLSTLRAEFGNFSISDIYDTEQRHGQEEIYWRLVRPSNENDVGPLHRDTWFHGAFNMGYGMFAEGVKTVKIWVPIYCELGKSGLALAKGSHLKEWKYHVEVVDGLPRPKLDEDPSTVGAALVPVEAGNLIIFNENVLHGGVVNAGNKTRVSAEITMVLN